VDVAILMSIKRLERAMNLFRDMLDDFGNRSAAS